MVTKKDLMVLSCLRQNARETLTQMSRRIKMPISTIYDRLKFQERDLIKRHTTLLDFSRLGFSTRVHMALRVERTGRQGVESYLRSHPHINSLYKINNGYDFLIECIFKHLKDLQEFVEDIEERFPVIEKQLFYIVEDIKREAFLADPSQLPRYIETITE